MGLTIHYSLKAQRRAHVRATETHTGAAQSRTRRTCPFKEVGAVVELSGEQCGLQQTGHGRSTALASDSGRLNPSKTSNPATRGQR